MSNIKNLYIHIPYCIRKCFYCDFYSVSELGTITDYIGHLCREIDIFFGLYPETKGSIETIFFGGGTPTLLNASQFETILRTLNNYISFSQLIEFTIESNPGTISQASLAEYRAIGVNRLSIGVQSFSDKELNFLQRIHNSQQAINSVLDARKAGFDNISLDLISCIPGQTLEDFEKSLEIVSDLSPEHLSVYTLIYEEGTPLYKALKKGSISELNNENQADIYINTSDYLSKFGYEHYEVSNFARDRKYCAHNLAYWNCSNYFAFGAAANGYIGDKRFQNFASIKKYINAIDSYQLPIDYSEELTQADKLNEYIMLGLRAGGIDLKSLKYYCKTQQNDSLNTYINELIDSHSAELSGTTLKLTPQGYLISDRIILEISSLFD